jgi:aquaporin Z
MSKQDTVHITKCGISELVGTFLLAVSIGVGVVGTGHFSDYNFLFIPILVGLTLGVLVYIFGSISGGHFNPAVTVAMTLFGRLSVRDAVVYVLMQIVGAASGFRIAEILIGAVPNVPTSSSGAAMLGEFIGAGILVAAVCVVVLGLVDKSVSGLVIGLSLTIGISLSLSISGGILNPAIALALGGYHISYLVAPVLGGIAGGGLVIWLNQK